MGSDGRFRGGDSDKRRFLGCCESGVVRLNSRDYNSPMPMHSTSLEMRQRARELIEAGIDSHHWARPLAFGFVLFLFAMAAAIARFWLPLTAVALVGTVWFAISRRPTTSVASQPRWTGLLDDPTRVQLIERRRSVDRITFARRMIFALVDQQGVYHRFHVDHAATEAVSEALRMYFPTAEWPNVSKGWWVSI